MSFAGGAVASTRLRDHDPRLDTAREHLEKGELLLNAVSSGELSKHNQKIFDKELARALKAVDDALAAIAAAVEAAEGGQ